MRERLAGLADALDMGLNETMRTALEYGMDRMERDLRKRREDSR